MGAPGLIKEIAKQMKDFDEIPRPIDKVIPPKQEQPKVHPLVMQGRPILVQPRVTVNNHIGDVGYLEIILVGLGSIFVGLFLAGATGLIK